MSQIIKGKELSIWTTAANESSIAPEELLLQSIIKVAVNDYIKCLEYGNMYRDAPISYKGYMTVDSCISIIKHIINHPMISIYYDTDYFEYIFKEIDKQNGYWYHYYCGGLRVHPWDVLHGNYNIIDSTRVNKLE